MRDEGGEGARGATPAAGPHGDRRLGPHARRPRPCDRRVRRVAPCAPERDPGGRHGDNGVSPGGIGHRKGSGGAFHPPPRHARTGRSSQSTARRCPTARAELFGYERGAFTGAHQAKAGQIEPASGGVLFLDEVSEMSLSAQAKFLRFLQEREFQRLGGTRTLKANVRVIAASNRDLRRPSSRAVPRRSVLPVAGVRHPDSAAARACRATCRCWRKQFSRSLGKPWAVRRHAAPSGARMRYSRKLAGKRS